MSLLRVQKHPHQALGVVFENRWVFRIQSLILADKTVKAFLLLFSTLAGQEAHKSACSRAGLQRLQMEPVHHFAAALQNVTGGRVVVMHQCLDAAQQLFMSVAEIGGHRSLQAQR